MSRPRIAVYYEHPEWFQPLFAALDRREVAVIKQWAPAHAFDPADREPGFDLLVNRMSPSSPTRGHGNALFYTNAYLTHVESLGIPVVNGTVPQRLEISKAEQIALLERLGIRYPRARVINHPSQAMAAARGLTFPIVTKANIGGSGAGILLFNSLEELAAAVEAGQLELGIDHTALVQEFHEAEGGYITRVEFLDGNFLYAIQVESNPAAGFNLCPADACAVPGQEAEGQERAATNGLDADTGPVEAPSKRKVHGYTPPQPIIDQVLRIAEAGQYDIGGVEYLISKRDGQAYFYDINALSNFVANAPQVIGFDPFAHFADYLVRRAQESQERMPTPA